MSATYQDAHRNFHALCVDAGACGDIVQLNWYAQHWEGDEGTEFDEEAPYLSISVDYEWESFRQELIDEGEAPPPGPAKLRAELWRDKVHAWVDDEPFQITYDLDDEAFNAMRYTLYALAGEGLIDHCTSLGPPTKPASWDGYADGGDCSDMDDDQET
jgi:hypothetical protein